MTNTSKFTSITTAEALQWEEQALAEVLVAQTPQLLIWESSKQVMVLPASSKWKVTTQLSQHMAEHGWLLDQRKTGGSPVPQAPGVLNLSIVYPWSADTPISTTKSYQLLINILDRWLAYYNLVTHTGEVEGAYCNGTYNLSVNNRKVIGTAQRIRSANNIDGKKQHAVLAHAFILINPNIKHLINAVNRCYKHHGHSETFKEEAMLSLSTLNDFFTSNYHDVANKLHQYAQSTLSHHIQQQ